MNEKQEQRWRDLMLPNLIERFSPVIRKVLNRIEIPQPKVENTFIWGGVGTGKTIHAVCMLIEAHRLIYEKHEPWPFWQFVSVPEFFLEIKRTYDRNSTVTECDVIDKYSECDFLILDDFGVEKTSEWSFQLLYILINRRYENQKTTVITSNKSLEELAEKLGDDRIVSRIAGMCKVIEQTGIDYRA